MLFKKKPAPLPPDGEENNVASTDAILSDVEKDMVAADEEIINEEINANPTIPKKVKWKNPFKIYILDVYILKKFLGTFFLATILFLAVIAMFDITEKLDAFLVAPFKETIFDYFCSFLTYFGNQLSPLYV
ncbi:MAG: LptF/LptG family permease, partial [Muribaculaceae bacterium]|nr:LptF/LptG family permease [Muribaculaceae bacterium]